MNTMTATSERLARLGILREPLGYVDGGDVYEYVKCSPVGGVDPMGLVKLEWIGVGPGTSWNPDKGLEFYAGISLTGLTDDEKLMGIAQRRELRWDITNKISGVQDAGSTTEYFLEGSNLQYDLGPSGKRHYISLVNFEGTQQLFADLLAPEEKTNEAALRKTRGCTRGEVVTSVHLRFGPLDELMKAGDWKTIDRREGHGIGFDERGHKGVSQEFRDVWRSDAWVEVKITWNLDENGKGPINVSSRASQEISGGPNRTDRGLPQIRWRPTDGDPGQFKEHFPVYSPLPISDWPPPNWA